MCYRVKIKFVFLVFIFFVSPKILAGTEGKFSPYIGGDMQARKMSFKQGFGDDLFKKESIQGNFYLGFKVNKYFGFEFGHQVANKKSRNASATATARLSQAGQRFLPGAIPSQMGIRQIKGWNLNVIGFLPISTEYKMSMIGIVGLSALEVKLKYTWTYPATARTAFYQQIKFKQRKNVLRLGGGVQKMFSDSFGVRTTIVWENTSRFNNIKQNYLGKTYTAKLKDSWTYGVGAFIMF
jgi:hypothetical protein